MVWNHLLPFCVLVCIFVFQLCPAHTAVCLGFIQYVYIQFLLQSCGCPSTAELHTCPSWTVTTFFMHFHLLTSEPHLFLQFKYGSLYRRNSFLTKEECSLNRLDQLICPELLRNMQINPFYQPFQPWLLLFCETLMQCRGYRESQFGVFCYMSIVSYQLSSVRQSLLESQLKSCIYIMYHRNNF